MTSTPDLIEVLVADLRPVQRWRPPMVRATRWLLLAALVLTVLAIGEGLRADIRLEMAQPRFLVTIAASALTGILAVIATFNLCVPGRSPLWGLLPLPSLVVWLSGIGYQCLTNWIDIGPNGMQLGETARCFATIVLTGLPLGLALALMLRGPAVIMRPASTILVASLAVAAMTATALLLFHPLDATIMILTVVVGTAMAIVGAGAIMGLWVRAKL